MRYKRKGQVTEKSNLLELSSLQKWILFNEKMSDWRDFGTILGFSKPYMSSDGRRILATNIQVAKAVRSLVGRGLLEVSR